MRDTAVVPLDAMQVDPVKIEEVEEAVKSEDVEMGDARPVPAT